MINFISKALERFTINPFESQVQSMSRDKVNETSIKIARRVVREKILNNPDGDAAWFLLSYYQEGMVRNIEFNAHGFPAHIHVVHDLNPVSHNLLTQTPFMLTVVKDNGEVSPSEALKIEDTIVSEA